MSIAEGGCVCTKVRYAVQSEPARITICHCTFCQKVTGGAYLVEPIFDEKDFSITTDDVKTYQHRSEGSGKLVYVHFCGACGTKLYLSFERFPDIIGVFGGTFDNPNWFERTPGNTKHIFLGVAQHGTAIPAGINTYLAHATENDGTPITPTVFTQPKIIGEGSGRF
jgi:hypothetical protein